MNILVACEESQAVTIELRELGHEAYSCDIEPCSGNHPEWHIMDDVLKYINGNRVAFQTMDGGGTYRPGKMGHDIGVPSLYSLGSIRVKVF